MSRSASADPKKIAEMIDHHFHTLHVHPRYGRCLNRVFIEANLSYIDANRIADQLRHTRYGSALDIVC